MVEQVTSLHDRGVSAGILGGNKGVNKKFVISKKDVLKSKFCILYSAPEAIVGNHQWKQLLLVPLLCTSIVAVAVDEA